MFIRSTQFANATVEIERWALIDRILAGERLCVLTALAGAGKSVLMRQLAHRTGRPLRLGAFDPSWLDRDEVLVWDAPANENVAVDLTDVVDWLAADSARKAIIARRPRTALAGFARASLYGIAREYGARELFFSLTELAAAFGPGPGERLHAETGGWPMLVALGDERAARLQAIATFLDEQLLAGLNSGAAAALDVVSRSQAPVAFASLSPTVTHELDGLDPLVVASGASIALAAPALRPALRAVLERRRTRLAGADEALSWARVERAAGQRAEAIHVLQEAGEYELAAQWFTEDGSFDFIHFVGRDKFDAVLAGFPETMLAEREALVCALAMQALKTGNLPRARLIIENRFGPAANMPAKVFARHTSFSRDFRVFRIVMAIYEEIPISEQTLEHIFALLAELPTDAYLWRGTFYNSILENYVRRRRFAEAESVAVRALDNYRQAGVPMLCFYIELFQAIIALTRGDVRIARRRVDDAAASLAALSFESPSDALLLKLLNACIDYDDGLVEPLTRFLADDFERFAAGEIWPSLVEFAIQYGSQVLSAHLSTFAARDFLDRWRIQQGYGRRFRTMLEIHEVTVLQNGNRWLEAAERLSPLQSRVNRIWVEAALPELTRLDDRDEIAITTAWLRHFVHETPTRPDLFDQIGALIANDHVTSRQKIGLHVWQAYVARRQRDLTRARTALLRAFEQAARMGCVAPLAEEKVLIGELIDNQRLTSFLQSSAPARAVLKRLNEINLTGRGTLNRAGLTRREARVLLMIAEGASNKYVARNLDVSEATVKFHLSNLYRKLGCTRRREAIAAARALGWIG